MFKCVLASRRYIHELSRRPLVTYSCLKNVISSTNTQRDQEKTTLERTFDTICKDSAYNVDGLLKEQYTSLIKDGFLIPKVQLGRSGHIGWDMEFPVRGLLILLISKAAAFASTTKEVARTASERKSSTSQSDIMGVLPTQLNLVKITEMLHLGFSTHSNINRINLTLSTIQGKNVAILIGDYLMSMAIKMTAELQHNDVYMLIAVVSGNITQGLFLSEMENKRLVTNRAKFDFNYWKEKNFLLTASLFASACEAALKLAWLGEELQAQAFDFGKNFGYCLKAYQEIQWFEGGGDDYRNKPVDLYSLPVLMHETPNEELIEFLEHKDSQLSLDRFRSIIRSGNAIDKSKEVAESFRKVALGKLNAFEDCEAKRYLQRLVCSIQL